MTTTKQSSASEKYNIIESEKCLTKQLGPDLKINNYQDLLKAKKCGDGLGNFVWLNLAEVAKSPRYLTTKKAIMMQGHKRQMFSHFTDMSKKEPVGAVMINLKNDLTSYIASEAPLDAELFLNMAWDNKISTYVTLTAPKDNDEQKLRLKRGLGALRVDLHFLQHMAGASINGFEVEQPSVISDDGDIAVISANVKHNNETRKIVQISYYTWQDGTEMELDKIQKLVPIIQQYHKNTEHPLFVNCFVGVGRTRGTIMATHIKRLHDAGKKINILKINNEYFLSAYNPQYTKLGDMSSAFGEGRTAKKDNIKILERYVDFLNQNKK